MWFKTKQEKQKDLQKELEELIEKHKMCINSYCKISHYIFILKGFKIEDNEICVQFTDKDSPEDYTNYMQLNGWHFKYNTIDFKKAEYQFQHFKADLKKIGLTLQKL